MTSDQNTILTFSGHDRALLVWGVVDDHGHVRAHRDHETATTAADAAGPITVRRFSVDKAPRTTSCSRLVYHHIDLGWVLAAIGHPVTFTDTD